MKKKINKNILLSVFVALLIFPAIQELLKLFKEKPLQGAVIPAIDTTLTAESWFNGRYQLIKEKYVNENFGFRKFFVRLNNQVAFSVYNIAKANGVVIGKDNYLFEEPYIYEYYGDDFLGKDSISNIIKKLNFIQDTLAKLNKTLVVIYAPSKAYLFPETIPYKYHKKRGSCNYNCFVEISKLNNLNFIDFNAYFIQNKNKSKYPLFSKYGIHWSIYSGCIVTDSIIRYIEVKRNIQMSKMIWDETKVENSKESDIDIADGMNLLFGFDDEKMGYPKVQFKNDTLKIRPSLLIISDSFYWIIYGKLSSAFKNDHFWYYNREIYPENTSTPFTTENVIFKDEIMKHDVIIILATAPSLKRIGWGFIENTYNLFNKNEREIRIEFYIENIKNNKEWLDKIIIQSKEKKIPIDQMIRDNAIWMVDNEKTK